jgi:cytochrome c peroxidase
MKKILSITCLTLCLTLISTAFSFAEELDAKLKNQIEALQLKPLKKLNDLNLAKYKLGQLLFRDPKLSGNQNISCMACHHIMHASVDGLPLSLGEGASGMWRHRSQQNGLIIPRHSPHIYNQGRDEMTHLFWDGRVSFDQATHTFSTPSHYLNGEEPQAAHIAKVLQSTLAAQALFPMLSPEEMRGKPGSNPIADLTDDLAIWEALASRIYYGANATQYQTMMQAAYPETSVQEWNIGHIAEAIGHFQKYAFDVTDTPWDRYLAGDVHALSPKEKLGADVFMNKGKCITCHSGDLLGGIEFENVGVPQIGPGKTENGDDLGRFHVTGLEEDKYLFRTPTLRNVALTAPYMHDGAFVSLRDVVNHYDHVEQVLRNYTNTTVMQQFGQNYSQELKVFNKASALELKISTLAPEILENNGELNLTEEEKDALVEFLEKSLTGSAINNY